MGYMGDVKTKTFIDDNASSATFVAAAAQPTSTFTLAATSFGTNTGRKITATTSGSGDGSKTVTIVGTDVNGDALTEVITLTGSAETSSGTTAFFQTITSATVSAQPAANVSLGMTADVAGGVLLEEQESDKLTLVLVERLEMLILEIQALQELL